MAYPKSQRKSKALGSSLEMAQFLDAGANKIKRRIRDLERLLKKKKDILPDTVIVEKERTLEALRMELENAELRHKTKQNAKKYHMVRFFETKKATRKYKKALKQLASAKDKDEKELRGAQLLESKIDLCYVVNFPKTEKYIALYPTENTDDLETGSEKTNISKENTNVRREAFRTLVANQLEEGTLPVSLEEIMKGKKLDKNGAGIMLEEDIENKSKKSRPSVEVKGSKEPEVQQNEEEEEEEDDFFE
ncbi:hypothetical protein NCAS_0E04070 [Naumovozyma castellii]|uniref:rRNA-processing protein EFG1 n=1 Tax=Naumovozyma castellii TaxID=27288 RepID=G0VG57_NAUCA|nr:hypothetical protein NCAS_0E04070 [Naumovozyma castellii CBS 4309]CCC70477.1 hypothetical protein NCAS_0E04070 [Naumovozyma castellii CBS 4309]